MFRRMADSGKALFSVLERMNIACRSRPPVSNDVLDQ